jgi:hypothetical protein
MSVQEVKKHEKSKKGIDQYSLKYDENSAQSYSSLSSHIGHLKN